MTNTFTIIASNFVREQLTNITVERIALKQPAVGSYGLGMLALGGQPMLESRYGGRAGRCGREVAPNCQVKERGRAVLEAGLTGGLKSLVGAGGQMFKIENPHS